MTDPNLSLFCDFCGTIVPITAVGGLKCPLCKESFDSSRVLMTEKTVVLVSTDNVSKKNVKSERPMIKERCPECSHEGLYFSTAQIRSADEGQTIFYECPECGHKYQQNA